MKYGGLKGPTQEHINGVIEGYTHLNNFLEGSKWVAGNTLTIADFSLIANITSLNLIYSIDEAQFPNITTWIKRAEELPYYHVNSEGLKDFQAMVEKLLSNKP